jgi:parvulin-like peptidyl-prolyl isomerase
MNSVRRLVRTCLVAAPLALGLAAGLAQTIPGVAARVNGVAISNLRLERHFEEYLTTQRRNISSMINPGVYKKLKREALDQLIERELLWQAAQADGVVAADTEVQAALQQMQAKLGSRDAFLLKLERAGFDEKSYAEVIKHELSGASYLVRKSSGTPFVNDDEVATFYRQNMHRFHKPEAARARHILIKVAANATPQERSAARAKIDALHAELQGGADFAELARRHSEDSTAPGGGDLGDVERGRTVKPFEEALFALAPGQVSDEVQTRFGLHLIKLEALVPAVTQPLAEVQDGIRARLLAEKRTALAREVVAGLRASARTEVLLKLD